MQATEPRTVPELVAHINASSYKQRRAFAHDAEIVNGLRDNGYAFRGFPFYWLDPVRPGQRAQRGGAHRRSQQAPAVSQPSLHQRVTAKRDQDILERYRNGQNQAEIAAELDVSTATVGHTLSKYLTEDEYAALSRAHHKADGQRRSERRKLGLAETVRADLLENGDGTISELVERTGLSYNVVSAAVEALLAGDGVSTYSDPKNGMTVGMKEGQDG